MKLKYAANFHDPRHPRRLVSKMIQTEDVSSSECFVSAAKEAAYIARKEDLRIMSVALMGEATAPFAAETNARLQPQA